MMQSQGIKSRFIKQIKLAGSKQYFPNRFFSPYEFMDNFNQAVQKKYDIKVVEVRYIINKSKSVKDMDDHTNFANLVPETEFNNIFSIQDEFMKELTKDIIELSPPEDFDPNKFEEESNAAKRQLEEKKNEEIDQALKLLTNIYLMHSAKEWKGKQLKSITRFKKEILPYMKESQVEIYIKALMSKPIEDRIENDKNSKNPIVISTQSKQQIRVYLHPVKNDPESEELVAKQLPITDWSLCTFAPNSPGSTYWSMPDIAKKAQQINGSIKPVHYIAIHKNKKGNMDYLQIYSFLFNQIVLKVAIYLAQIKKVEIYDSKKGEKPTQQEYCEYYFHLAYPPKYYMSILKPDVGCNDGFIRNWERLQNFAFLRNPEIMKDQFLRLYLFNNTVFKVRLCKSEFDFKIEPTKDFIKTTIQHFKGTIKTEMLKNPHDFGRRLTNLTTMFKYKNFKDKFQYSLTQGFTQDKVWKLKYLILVEVRYNRIVPSEIQKILAKIEDSKGDIDIFLYIFWQNVALLSTVSPEGNRQEYLPLLESQLNQIKKLSISDITKKVSSNTEFISYIFRASLTPSGYLYDPPTPQMKGRLMKQYSSQSEHFMRVSFADDNQGTLKNQKYITKYPLKSMMKKIPILEREYIPLGWSPSQLRSYSLWYIHQISSGKIRLTRTQVLSFLGDFRKIQNPAKKAARIGQSFSSSWTYECKMGEIKEDLINDDYSTKNYMYTDGIGKISSDLLQKMSLKLHIKDLSVVQIRYKGAKGILVLDSSLPNRTIHMRPSMIKYECRHDSATKYLDILDWNKYKAGFLNRQTIVLLKSLGISDQVFSNKHIKHVQNLSNLSFKDCSIFKHMNEELNTDINNLEPANVTILHLLRAGFKLQNQPFFRGVLQTMKKNGFHQLKVKCNIMIDKSARIIGIIDEWDILQEGELYCTVEDSLQTHPKKIHVEGDVIITRNPCLHPADIRKMKCVSNQEISARFEKRRQDNLFLNYINCVIFPKKGEIPVTSQISGSDLDGDNFWICWDPELIPQKHEPCYIIDNPITSTDKKPIKSQIVVKNQQQEYNQMLNFFVQYLNYEKLGQIDNSHLVHADRSPFYAKAGECIQLAVAHGKAVDFPKSGFCPEIDPKLLVSTYPDFMEKQQSPEYYSESILGKLYRDIKGRIANLLANCQTHKTGKMDDELMQQLVKSQNFKFQSSEVKETIQILLNYEKQLSGLINLVGVDTEYQIYSGNFSIAKDKVKAFGKNRLIATILTLRSKYFDEFFNNTRLMDKETYIQATENDLQRPNLFASETRKRALLFYACSYLMKYHQDQDFLNGQHLKAIRQQILSQFKAISYLREGKFCGFVWFVVPKIMINQKYRIKKITALNQQQKSEQNNQQQPNNVNQHPEQDEQQVI